MQGEWKGFTTRTVNLDYDQLLVLESPPPGAKVRVLYGNLWLTEEGNMQDVFAGSGAEIALKARGRAVIEGLGEARLQVIEPRGVALFTRVARWLEDLRVGSRVRSLRHAAVRVLHV